jgi:hypothetical protein
MRLRLPLVSALLLGGCSSIPADYNANGDAAEMARVRRSAMRERELQNAWRGKPYVALVEAYGAPSMIMNVPGFRPLKTSVAVYGVRDDSSRCIDAFTVVKHGVTGEWTVADYFCR